MAICKYYLQGSCKFGERCHYEHPRGREAGSYANQGSYDLRQRLTSQDQGNYGNQRSNQRDYSSNQRDYGSNQRDYGSNQRDYGSNQRDYGSNQQDYSSNQRGGGYSRGGRGNNYNNRGGNNSNFPQGSNKFAALSETGGSGRSYQGQRGQQDPSPDEVLQSISQDMEEWENTGAMWSFSCYAFAKDIVCMPGLEDLSPEEVRLKAYEAQSSGDVNSFNQWYQQLKNDYINKRKELMRPNVSLKAKLYDVIDTILKAADSKSNSQSSVPFGASSSSSGASAFGGFSQQTTTSSVPSLFANSQSAPAVGPFSNQTTTTTGPLQGGSVFGGGGPTAGGGFGNSSSSASSPALFAGVSNPGNASAPGLFGKPPTSQTPQFGTSSTLSMQPTVLFGKPVQPVNTSQTSVFGNTGQTSTNQNNAFGQASTNQSSAFGQTATNQSSAFGQTSTSSTNQPGAFGQTSTNQTVAFGQTSTNQTNAFGQTSTNQSSVFGGTPSTAQPTSSGTQAPQKNSVTGQPKTQQYTPLDQLSADERTAFEAQKFVLGKIPTRPPPRELI